MRFFRYAPSLIILFFISMLIAFPEKYVQSVYNGTLLFAVNVLPAMFPFFFFSGLLTSLGAADALACVFDRPMRKLFKVPPVGAYVFSISILSGYPVGAKLLADLYSANRLSSKECAKISTFTSTSGPLFIVGTVGTAMLCNKLAGYIILFSHVSGALLNGLLYRNIKTENTSAVPASALISYDNLLSEGITSALKSVLIVGGYIAVFNMIADALSDTGLFGIITFPLQLVKASEDTLSCANALITGIIEVTRGCLELSRTGLGPALTATCACFLISFGGLSVTLQSLTFLSKCKIKAGFYLLSKLTQAIVSCGICLPVCLLIL